MPKFAYVGVTLQGAPTRGIHRAPSRSDAEVALYQRVLGDDRARMAASGQQLQRGAGEAPALLNRLVGVGVAADVDRLHPVARPGQLVP